MVDVKDLLLSGRSIAYSVGAELIGDDASIADVQIDSRECGTNTLFVPLKGENTDGHFFIEAAVAAGSSLCFVHRHYYLEHEAYTRAPSSRCRRCRLNTCCGPKFHSQRNYEYPELQCHTLAPSPQIQQSEFWPTPPVERRMPNA